MADARMFHPNQHTKEGSMTQRTPTTRRPSFLGATVAVYAALVATTGLVATSVARVARRARRDEAGFGEISQAVAIGAVGVVAIIAALALFRPVLSDIIDKIRTDVLGQTP